MKKKKLLKKERLSSKFKPKSPFRVDFLNNFNSFFRIQKNNSTFCTKISFRITSNNVFLTMFDLVSKKVLFQMSAGMVNLNSSKRLAKNSAHKIVSQFIKKCRLQCYSKRILFEYSGPSRLRRPLLRRFLRTFKNWRVRLLSIFLSANIIFNGCRPPKRRRKKKIRFRLSRS